MGVVRQDERQNRKRHEDGEVGARALNLEILLPILKASERMQRPTMPLQTIMITEKTVSRARAGSPLPLSVIDMMSATSMIVTAMVSTSVP